MHILKGKILKILQKELKEQQEEEKSSDVKGDGSGFTTNPGGAGTASKEPEGKTVIDETTSEAPAPAPETKGGKTE